MKKAIVLLVVALAIPTSAAFAKASPTRGKSNPRVMYVLKGVLSGYDTTTQQVSILVKHSNYHARALRDQTLTFSIAPTTRITYANGATTITDGAKGVLKFKAPLRFAAGTDLATALPATEKALHIIDLAQQ